MKKNIEEATPKYVPVLSSSMKELETIKQMDTEEKLMLKKQIKAPAPVFISFNQSDVAPEPDAVLQMPQDVPKKMISETNSFFKYQKLSQKSKSMSINKNWKVKEISVGNSRSTTPKKIESTKEIPMQKCED